jgi:hypothetical protein
MKVAGRAKGDQVIHGRVTRILPLPAEAVKRFRPLMNAEKRGLKMLVLSALIRVNLRPDSIFSQLLTVAALSEVLVR